jgi:hypothetical protein
VLAAHRYASDPWHVAADASISDWWWTPNQVFNNFASHTFVGPNWVQLTRSTGMATNWLDIPLNYEISFAIMPGSTTVGAWANVLHFSADGGNCCS